MILAILIDSIIEIRDGLSERAGCLPNLIQFSTDLVLRVCLVVLRDLALQPIEFGIVHLVRDPVDDRSSRSADLFGSFDTQLLEALTGVFESLAHVFLYLLDFALQIAQGFRLLRVVFDRRNTALECIESGVVRVCRLTHFALRAANCLPGFHHLRMCILCLIVNAEETRIPLQLLHRVLRCVGIGEARSLDDLFTDLSGCCVARNNVGYGQMIHLGFKPRIVDLSLPQSILEGIQRSALLASSHEVVIQLADCGLVRPHFFWRDALRRHDEGTAGLGALLHGRTPFFDLAGERLCRGNVVDVRYLRGRHLIEIALLILDRSPFARIGKVAEILRLIALNVDAAARRPIHEAAAALDLRLNDALYEAIAERPLHFQHRIRRDDDGFEGHAVLAGSDASHCAALRSGGPTLATRSRRRRVCG
ncbi:hypothetical protein BN2475_420023 [Paraburkholderia ribeironis]|uniref:Uncharacterized protein n=1 Tax=Paraburkholderia ribeironis TaxID=1247936 RepID=A0A1N7S777_9BURK|nr:hypothetical protein BN2475_420023 [Paraburkholderia ribeironis]